MSERIEANGADCSALSAAREEGRLEGLMEARDDLLVAAAKLANLGEIRACVLLQDIASGLLAFEDNDAIRALKQRAEAEDA